MPITLYEYQGTVRSVYDGDTLRIDLDLGFHSWRMNEVLRLYGINAPELTGVTRTAGLAARDALRLLVLDKTVTLRTIKADKQEKYGRYLAVVYVDNVCVNDWLVENGHAIVYMLGDSV